MCLLAECPMFEDPGIGIATIAVSGGLLVAIVAIIFSTVKSIILGRAREQTKRELAAYVAEGTMDPNTAVELAKAGKTSSSGCCEKT